MALNGFVAGLLVEQVTRDSEKIKRMAVIMVVVRDILSDFGALGEIFMCAYIYIVKLICIRIYMERDTDGMKLRHALLRW